jgi:methyl-accepting chemotaxis protein
LTLTEITQALDAADTAYLGPKADMLAVREGIAPYLAGIEQAAALVAQGKVAEARALVRGALRQQLAQSAQSVTRMLTFAQGKAAELADRSAATAAATERLIWTVTGAAIVIGLLVAWVISRGITGPVGRLGADIRSLADGERSLDIRGVERRDELGAIAQAVRVLRDSLGAADAVQAEQAVARVANEKAKTEALMKMAETIETDSAASLGQIRQRADEMASTADGLSVRADNTKQSAEAAAEAAREALATVQTVASAAEELSASIHEISNQMRQSTTLVGQAVTAGGEARGTIEALNETVMRIGAVADMIGEIAGKTNLLALNATIEAARAGDAGKGFAVVASEVKQLAAQTARSTGEIAQQLNEVRAATGASVAAVNRIEATITEINTVAGAIAQAVEQQGVATAEIAHTVAQTAEAANRVTSRINEVSQEASDTGSDAARVHATAEALTQSVVDLRHALVRVVRTSSAEVDRRQGERFPVDLPCHVTVGGETTAERLLDISDGGAAVTPGRVHHVGAKGTLRIPGVGFDLPFVVRQVGEQRVNLAFDLAPDLALRFAGTPARLAQRTAA